METLNAKTDLLNAIDAYGSACRNYTPGSIRQSWADIDTAIKNLIEAAKKESPTTVTAA